MLTEWGIAVKSADGGTLIQVNPAYARMHGYSVDELQGQPVALVLPPEQADDPVRLATLGDQCLETVHRRRDGSLFPVRLNTTRVRGCEGGAGYRVISVQDMSEHHRTQEALNRSQGFFEVVFDAAPVGMAVADESGRYVKVNQAIVDFLGYSEDELLSMVYHDITHPDDRAENIRRRADLLAGACSSFQMEKRYVRKDGRVVWALLVAAALPTRPGQARYTVGQMLDIDRLKRSEQELRLSQARLARAQQIGRIGDWQWDLATRFNHSAEAGRILVGDGGRAEISREELLAVIHPEDRNRVEQSLGRLATGELAGGSMDLRLLSGEGASQLVEVQCELERDGAGQPRLLTGIIQDVTERKAIESALRQSQHRLREVATHQRGLIEAERKHIAREIHDEIGSLLTALKLNVSLLRLRHGSTPGITAHVGEMQDLLDRTIQVVRDVATSLRPAVLDLGVIPAIKWLAEDFSRRYSIPCHVEAMEIHPPLNEAQMEAVFRIGQESLTNVARHAGATEVRIVVGCEAGTLFLEICDNGRGLPEGFIFGDQTMGLLGMRERARSVGGWFQLENNEGAGLRISLDLPLTEGGAP